MMILGPKQTPEQALQSRQHASVLQGLVSSNVSNARACNCVGPQPGERKCPCQLASEMAQGIDMISNGVVIAGRKYRLVLDDAS